MWAHIEYSVLFKVRSHVQQETTCCVAAVVDVDVAVAVAAGMVNDISAVRLKLFI